MVKQKWFTKLKFFFYCCPCWKCFFIAVGFSNDVSFSFKANRERYCRHTDQPQQHRNISDRVREPSIKFGNLLVSPYIKTDVAAMSWSTLPIYFYCRFTFQTPRIYEPPLSFTFDSGVYRQIPDTQSLLTENQAAEMV